MAGLIPDISHPTSWPEMFSHRPRRWEGRGRAGLVDSVPWKPAVLLLCRGKKSPGGPGAQRHLGQPMLMGFSTGQPPGPGKLSQKHLSLVEDYKRKRVKGWRQPSALCRKKPEQSSHPLVEGVHTGVWWCGGGAEGGD